MKWKNKAPLGEAKRVDHIPQSWASCCVEFERFNFVYTFNKYSLASLFELELFLFVLCVFARELNE